MLPCIVTMVSCMLLQVEKIIFFEVRFSGYYGDTTSNWKMRSEKNMFDREPNILDFEQHDHGTSDVRKILRSVEPSQ